LNGVREFTRKTKGARMAEISGMSRVSDERVKCLRIFADPGGETHMEDVDITLQPRKLFKDNPPLRLSENFPASWCNVCHVPGGMGSLIEQGLAN
jgi:hypothetical protein